MKLQTSFFTRDVLIVAPELLGKTIVRIMDNGSKKEFQITEVEVYRGEEDMACHARKGRTPRTEVMYANGGTIYVYLIYGMYWMLNFVTATEGIPQAILIRGVDLTIGPGKVTKLLEIDKSFNTENLCTSNRIWVEDKQVKVNYTTAKRVGIEYAGEYWKNIEWRFILKT